MCTHTRRQQLHLLSIDVLLSGAEAIFINGTEYIHNKHSRNHTRRKIVTQRQRWNKQATKEFGHVFTPNEKERIVFSSIQIKWNAIYDRPTE